MGEGAGGEGAEGGEGGLPQNSSALQASVLSKPGSTTVLDTYVAVV